LRGGQLPDAAISSRFEWRAYAGRSTIGPFESNPPGLSSDHNRHGGRRHCRVRTGSPRQHSRQDHAVRGDGAVPITLRINGKDRNLRVDPRTTLLDCIRETVALTGTKKGCDHGQCGACTVHVNGRRVNSCLTLALMHDGEEITTIEGLGTPDALHPMQAAFVAHDGYQCGYCTSGQIMSGVALLKEPCGPDDAAVKELMSGNICRCGAYANIVAAIQQVRKNA
jgi:xanthine dehydrogenase YagT iron-sulfur-binding subunit